MNCFSLPVLHATAKPQIRWAQAWPVWAAWQLAASLESEESLVWPRRTQASRLRAGASHWPRGQLVSVVGRAGVTGGRWCRSGLRLRPLTHRVMELRAAGMRLAVARAASRRARAAGERAVAIEVMRSVEATTSSAARAAPIWVFCMPAGPGDPGPLPEVGPADGLVVDPKERG